MSTLKSLSKILVKRTSLLIIMLVLLQEYQLETKLIQDFTPYTGGKTYNNLIHYLQSSTTNTSIASLPNIQMFHGFGASSLSFVDVIHHFTNTANVIATDLTGFGFNNRKSFSQYNDLAFSPIWNAVVSNEITQLSNPDQSKHIIVGHSFGCIPAIAAAILKLRSSSKLTLILEAPAIIFPPAISVSATSDPFSLIEQVIETSERIKARAVNNNHNRLSIGCIVSTLLFSPLYLLRFVISLGVRLVLRRITHWDSFWSSGLKAAFHSEATAGPGPKGYQLPSLAKGFDSQFVSFLFAQLLSPFRYSSPYLTKDVSVIAALRVLAEAGVSILLIHGRKDRIVPVENSRRIVLAVPGARLMEMGECGHIPHEEKADMFYKILEGRL
jgi:pimeloyl-ACP methyl ester carboxylesterase